ncbi:hypothetical protein ABEO75_28050, partial [Paenibacillus macerans]|uniref:hypothetical protein n=1 Tax=Paenibacillus macerans TaxID=44252 RepID=UPI003D28997C
LPRSVTGQNSNGNARVPTYHLFNFPVRFFVASLSYALSMIFKTENSFLAIVNTFTLPIFFVSTSLMSYEYIPDAFKTPVSLNPFHL